MANLIASLLAFAFYQINGATGTRSHGLYPWQWMTVCIGLISFCASRQFTRTSRRLMAHL